MITVAMGALAVFCGGVGIDYLDKNMSRLPVCVAVLLMLGSAVFLMCGIMAIVVGVGEFL